MSHEIGLSSATVEVTVDRTNNEYIIEFQYFYDNDEEEDGMTAEEEDQYNIDQYRYSRRA